MVFLLAGWAGGQSASPLQGGETIANAFVITGTLPFSASGTTLGYTDDYDEACPYDSSQAPDVVYSYTPAASVIVDIDLCGSEYDTKIFVYENTVTPGIPYDCNDDFYYEEPCGLYVSKIEGLLLTGGNTYYIIVDGYSSGDFGNYDLSVTQSDNTPQCIIGINFICPAWAVDEPEDCGQDENGGCNMIPGNESWESVPSAGATYCGSLFADNGDKDSDWYELVLSEPSSVVLTANAEQQISYGLAETTTPGAPTCITLTGDTEPGAVAGPCSETSVDLGTLAPGTYWLVIEMTATSGFPCSNHYVFDIDVNPVPCPPPDFLTATGITSFGATLGWFETGTAASWEYQYGVSGFTPAGSGISTVANPVAVTGLAISTAYDFYARAVCGPGIYSAWSGPYTFTTLCGTINSIPWSEGFESGWPPACWTDDNALPGYGWDHGVYGSPGSGSKWAYSNLSGSVLTSPSISLSADAYLFFSYRAENKDFPRNISVKINNDEVFQVNGFTSEDYSVGAVSLATYIGQTVAIAFETTAGSGGQDFGICLDDVTVKFAVKWTGNLGTAWSNPGNWSTSSIPGINDVVVVPSVPSGGNFPEVGSGITATCYFLELAPGATLKVKTGGTLNVLNY
ncbi:MAG TPA: choice-of-anchor J domain-containing protein [Bacteroidales bacterium]|nr:choice-of-anchor J domain-containing protein [Bacteroidales bacterium]HPM93846.1 choice-of-anchor J domain-containing protein [Bacteroidales bacterium]